MPLLKRGSTGESVVHWQHALNAAAKWRPPLLIGDGLFGPITEERTREFQAVNGLDADGIVGPLTRAAMGGVGFLALEVGHVFRAIRCARPKYPVELVIDTGPTGWLAFAAITTRARAAALLAQTGHESGRFRYLGEIWGPTPAQRRYEPPSRKATELGNIRKGDGKRFKGRGPIQTTGRTNYHIASRDLGLGDTLEDHPERVALPEIGLLTSASFWKRTKCNALADQGTAESFRALTKRINGGYTHHAERVVLWNTCRRILGLA